MIKRSLLFGLYVLIALAVTSCASKKGVATKSDLSFSDKARFDDFYFKASKEKVLGNYTQAAKYFAEALKVDPKSHAVMYQMANLNMAVSGFNDAVYWSEKAMLTNPDYNYWYAGQLAQAYSKVGQYEKSAQVFEIMIDQEPAKSMSYEEASKQYINAREFKKSINVLESYVSQFGINEDVARLLEGLNFEIGKNKEAIQWMEKLLVTKPDDNRFKGLLAESYMRDGQMSKAKSIYLQILKETPANGYANFGLADLYKKERSEDSSFYFLGTGFKDVEVPISLKMKVIGSFLPYLRTDPKMLDRALELTKTLVEVHPQEEKAYLTYGDILHASGRFVEARSEILKAAEIDPSNINIWRKLLSIDDEMKNDSFLVSDAKQALDYFPNQPFLYIVHAFGSYQLNKFEEAIASAEEGLEIAYLKSDKIDLLTTVGDASYELNMFEKCFETYDEILELDGNNDGALNNYAYYLSEQSANLDLALEMINKALEKNPNRPTYLDTKGWVLFQLGKYDEAIVFLEKAHGFFTRDAEVTRHYAECLIKVGQVEKGQKLLKELNK